MEMAKEGNKNEKWWTSLTDEDPITLEPLAALPYPPFVLIDGCDEDRCGSRREHYFDGVALATYVVSQGTFANPLTRAPLTHGNCIQLDEYLFILRKLFEPPEPARLQSC